MVNLRHFVLNIAKDFEIVVSYTYIVYYNKMAYLSSLEELS